MVKKEFPDSIYLQGRRQAHVDGAFNWPASNPSDLEFQETKAPAPPAYSTGDHNRHCR
jgi:hypothetical protein